MFNTSTAVSGTVEWVHPTWFWHAFGRVSPEVTELFAVIPNGEAINVPVGATGAFALSWNRKVDTSEQVPLRPPLSLYARDGAGQVLSSVGVAPGDAGKGALSRLQDQRTGRLVGSWIRAADAAALLQDLDTFDG